MPEDNNLENKKDSKKNGSLKNNIQQKALKSVANHVVPGAGKIIDTVGKKVGNNKANVGKKLLNNNTGIKTPNTSPLQKEKEENENKLTEQLKKNAVRSVLNVVAPGLGDVAGKVMDAKEKKDDNKETKGSPIKNPLENKKKQIDAASNMKVNIQADLFKKAVPILIGMLLVFIIIIISIIPSVNYDNEFADLRGVGGSGKEADVEGNADSEETKDMYNRIITAKSDYSEFGISIRPDLIVSVYHVLSNETMFNEKDMTREVIDEIIRYMFPDECVDKKVNKDKDSDSTDNDYSSNDNCIYSEQLFRTNLETIFFPKYINDSKRCKDATDEVFDYIERYREYIGYTGSDLSFGDLMCSDISLTSTTLSREQFIEKVNNYASQSNLTGVRLFAQNAGNIYDISIQNNFNPEMVMIRAQVEGFSPGGSTYNYYGLGCSNNGGGKDCQKFSSFDAGVLGFISNIKKHGYTSLLSMMSKYAYIGSYWYNPGGSGQGGCYYYNYVKKYLSSDRSSTVGNACSSSACSGSSCLKTTEEDQNAYAHYQSERMLSLRGKIFNISETDCTESGQLAISGGVSDVVKYAIATFDNYGYSQASRMSDSYVDCSSMVWRSYKHFGIQMGGSNNYASDVKGIKSWCESNNKMISEGELQPGDLVIRIGGNGNHVEMYIGNGQTFGAHTDKIPHDRQVSIVPYSRAYQYFCRPTK